MSKAYFDSEDDKSLDKKLSDFYNRWDSMDAEQRDKLMLDVQQLAVAMSQVNFAGLSDEDLVKFKGETESLMKMIGDIQAALEHRAVARTEDFYEQLKHDAESGDEEAKKLWEEVKELYYQSKLSDHHDN